MMSYSASLISYYQTIGMQENHNGKREMDAGSGGRLDLRRTAAVGLQ